MVQGQAPIPIREDDGWAGTGAAAAAATTRDGWEGSRERRGRGAIREEQWGEGAVRRTCGTVWAGVTDGSA